MSERYVILSIRGFHGQFSSYDVIGRLCAAPATGRILLRGLKTHPKWILILAVNFAEGLRLKVNPEARVVADHDADADRQRLTGLTYNALSNRLVDAMDVERRKHIARARATVIDLCGTVAAAWADPIG